MRTSLPFLDFKPETFISRRFAPLIATVVDEDVDAFVKKCGFSFADLLASVASTCLAAPLRIAGRYLLQTDLGTFESLVAKDLQDFSAPFETEEFEKTGAFTCDSCDFPTLLYSPLEFSVKPLPWYQGFLFRLLETLMYSDFEFCDLPSCVLYATTAQSKTKTVKEILEAMDVPPWMAEFFGDIPIVCVVVSDGLSPETANFDPKKITGFAQVFSTVVRSKPESNERMDRVLLERMFGLDLELMMGQNLGKFIGSTDIDNITTLLTQVQEYVMGVLRQKEELLAAEVGKFSGLKYRLFRGGQPEATSKYMGVVLRKLLYLQHAAVCMSLHKYSDALREFRAFATALEFDELPEVKSRALLYATLCFFRIGGYSVGDFVEQTELICRSILTEQRVTCPRTALAVPILAMELLQWRYGNNTQRKRDRREASRISKLGLSIIRTKWPASTRVLLQALLYERISSLLYGNNTAALYLAEAGVKYHECSLYGHVLRVLKWLMTLLPQSSWTLLRQQVWLEKVGTLKELKFDQRSLYSCRDLLALPDLCSCLQERVLAMFWYPFNLPSVAAASRQIEMRNLVEIKEIQLIDCTQPSYYGYPQKEFHVLTKLYDRWFMANVSRSASISFDEIWKQSNSSGPLLIRDVQVPCDTIVKIVVGLSNRFTFAVHLDETSVKVRYDGLEAGDFELNKLSQIEVPSLTNKPIPISYDMIPRSEGRYTITEFQKRYWGYVDASIKCEPLSFYAVRDFARVSVTAEDLPDAVFQDSCQEFYVFVENTGSVEITELRIAFDHPELIIYHGAFAKRVGDKLFIVKVCETLIPGASISVPMIFKAPHHDRITIHGFVDVAGNKVAYLVKDIRTIPVINVEAERCAVTNATDDYIIKCRVQALADDIEVYGIIDNEGRKLKTLEFCEKLVLHTGDSVQFVSLMNEREETSDIESWRQSNHCRFSLLYKIQMNEMMSQRDLQISSSEARLRYTLDMPDMVTCKPGQIVQCSVCVEGQGPPVYLEPLPFAFTGNVTGNVVGLRFVGKTRLELAKVNDYRAVFSFMALASGIYKFVGFKTSNSPKLTPYETVSVSGCVCVRITNE